MYTVGIKIVKVLQKAEGPKNSNMALELLNYLTWAKHFSEARPRINL